MSMPAGKYWIGDLCYVLHDAWDEVCELTIKDRRVLDGEFTLSDGRRFATYTTMYGDGEYPASNGARLGVDAGLIGCIKFDDIKDETYENCEELGTVVEFDEEFDTSSHDGKIYFGHIIVDTNPDYDDEDPYYDDDEDEDDYR